MKSREKPVHRVRWTDLLSIHRDWWGHLLLHSRPLHRLKNSVENVDNSRPAAGAEISPFSTGQYPRLLMLLLMSRTISESSRLSFISFSTLSRECMMVVWCWLNTLPISGRDRFVMDRMR